MEPDQPAPHGSLKDRAIEEIKIYWIIALYLLLSFGALVIYRRLVVPNHGITPIHYGFAAVESLIIAKVMLIGRAFGYGRRYDHLPLIVPVIYKSVMFGILVFAFGLAERAVEAMIHRQGMRAVLDGISALGMNELLARVLMLMLAFIPFFAFWEMGRTFGFRRIAALFFVRREPAATPARRA